MGSPLGAANYNSLPYGAASQKNLGNTGVRPQDNDDRASSLSRAA